jgi:hypothetical protein
MATRRTVNAMKRREARRARTGDAARLRASSLTGFHVSLDALRREWDGRESVSQKESQEAGGGRDGALRAPLADKRLNFLRFVCALFIGRAQARINFSVD